MKLLLKIIGAIEFVGGIILFFGSLDDKGQMFSNLFAIFLGAVLFWLGYFADSVNQDYEKTFEKLENNAVEIRKMQKNIEELEKKINKL